MKLVAISRVRNEIDIVEAFVRHTAAFVDMHLVVDNGSTDGTLEVLHALARDGVPLEITEHTTPGYEAALVMSDLMRTARERFDAHWVLPLDADELLGVGTRADLERALARCQVPALVRWRTYVPHLADDPAQLNPLVRMRHRLHAEGHPWSKVLVPGELAGRSVLGPGHHDVLTPDGPHARETLDEVPLCHFPVRSPSQYAIKVVMGNLYYISRGGHRGTLGFHYEEPFRRLLEDWPGFVADCRVAAQRFALPPDVDFDPEVVDDPFSYRGGPLRSTPPPRSGEPLRTIVEYARSLAIQIGDSNPNPL